MSEPEFSALRAVQAEGARIGLVTCGECGAALVIDPADKVSPVAVHSRWHHEVRTVQVRDVE